MSEPGHLAALSRFLRCSEETSSTSGRSSGPQALSCTFSPLKMMRTLLMSLVSCLVAINEAKLINRCDLARVLHKEDLDGFEGYSLSDCECHFLTLPPPPPFLFCSWSPPMWPSFHHSSFDPSSKGRLPREAPPNILYSFHNC